MANFDMNSALESRWMQRHHVPAHGVDLTIREVTHENVGDLQEDKFALHFHGSYKPLLLNKTNIRVLTSLFGSQSGDWSNKQVNVYDDPNIAYGGKLVGGVRLRAATGATAAPGGLSKEKLEAAAKAYLAAQGGTAPAPKLEEDMPW